MKTITSLFLLGLSLMSIKAEAFNQGMEFHRQSKLQQKLSANLMYKSLRADGSLRAPEIAFFDQKLDHNDPASTTFKQRFFVDSHYAVDESSPVFYIICGEWNCAGTGSYGYAEGLAKKVKAHIVALEHRYYGESLPTSNLTPENLKNLTLDAAIEDLATVQRHLMESKKLSGKWIGFGGSYAGTLAAFYRLKHPELVTGVLASSAPVLMKPDFYEYDAHIAKVVSTSVCGDKVREAVRLIEERMKAGETEILKNQFGSSIIVNDQDFLYVVADMLAAAVQYGRDKVFCDALLKSEDLVAGYAAGGLKVLSSLGYQPYDLSMQSAEKVEVTKYDNFRQWIWQSCSEFGWFQVSNTRGLTSRSSQIDLEYHEKVCQRLYQTPMNQNHEALNALWYLPLFNPETSGIIFSNGSNDPWLTLSVTTSTNPELDLYVMDGAAHCDDLKAIAKLPSIAAAQQQMSSVIEKWLE